MGIVSLVEHAKQLYFSDKSGVVRTERKPWQYQYPHSVPVVLVLELGLVGAFLLVSYLWLLLWEACAALSRRFGQQGGRYGLCALSLLLAVLPLLLTDHYLWTSQQGRLLFWGVLGVLAGTRVGAPRG